MSTEVRPTKPAKVYISYSPKDEKLKEELLSHLSVMERQGDIESWDIRQIRAGDESDKETLKQLNNADIILCLLSARFMSSEYHQTVEMQYAFERQRLREVAIIPILLRSVTWQGTPFQSLQIIPRDHKPIAGRANRDKIFTEVVREISSVVDLVRGHIS